MRRKGNETKNPPQGGALQKTKKGLRERKEAGSPRLGERTYELCSKPKSKWEDG